MSYGRTKIYTNTEVITAANVVKELQDAYAVHKTNRQEIQTLWDYYRGKTKILNKVKEVRDNINHKINENRAYQIVSFHKGYTFGEPIQYIRRENTKGENTVDDVLASEINALNAYMSDADKSACDNELAEWLYVCGTSYRFVLSNKKYGTDDEPPFNVYSLDPRNTFVVYHAGASKKPIMGVTYYEQDDGTPLFSVYTEDAFYEIKGDSVPGQPIVGKAHDLGMIPIIEYPANNPRLGVFEVVMPLLDALDELQSNRLDDVVQFVNSFLAILGAEISEDVRTKLEEYKMLQLPEGADAKYLAGTLNQAEVQTLKADLLQSILEVCGVPNRNGGSSTSDTGSAVIMRDGWESAEAHAKSVEEIFKKSEKQTLRLVLRILRDKVGTELKLSDIVTHFTRRNYENIASKSQVLIAMLNNQKIHPELAFAHCGMFADPESAYLQSKAWWEEQQKQEEKEAEEYVKSLNEEHDHDDTVQDSGQSDIVSE